MFGEAELGYSKYDLDGAASLKSSQETFYHRYALGYEKGGRIGNGRLGKYSFILGYEWASVNQHSDGNVYLPASTGSITRGHLLFGGDLQMQLPQYPVNLTLYSRDLSRSMTTDYGKVETFRGGQSTIINPLTVNLTGATRVTSGAKLEIGTRGDQVFRAAPYFRELPIIILDYRNIYVSDLNSTAPQHTNSDSFLGAIGKKDLWVRYSNYRFTDYFNKGTGNDSSSTEQQFQLGTVDSHLSRRWVDVTNWIRISADGLLIKKGAAANSAADNTDQYEVNLFAIAEREKWSARTFNTFSRTLNKSSGTISHSLNLPIYLNGEWGTDARWQASFVSNENQSIVGQGATRSLLSTLRVEAFKRSPFTLTPSISVQRTTDNFNSVVKINGKVETTSTRRYSDKLGLFASYQIEHTRSDQSGDVQTSSPPGTSLLQQLDGRATYRVNDRLLVSVSEALTLKTGAAEATTGNGTSSTQTLQSTARNDTGAGEYIQSATSVNASWQPQARLSLGANATADVRDQFDGSMDNIFSFGNTIDYTLPDYKFSGRVTYAKRTGDVRNTTEINAQGGATYTPTRNLEAYVRLSYSNLKDESGTYSFVDFRQRTTYRFFRSGYNARTLLEVAEEASYEEGGGANFGATYNVKRNLTLLANYFPYQNLFVGASTRYSLLDPGSVSEWFGNATVGLNYRKLQASIDYAYGKRNGTDNRVEKRISANLKKQF